MTKGRTRMLKNYLLVGLGAIWVASIAYGFWAVHRFEATPGLAAPAPTRWPRASTIALGNSRPALVMFVHPQCSCTRASLEELAIVMNQLPEDVEGWVVIEEPTPVAPATNEGSPLLAQIARLPRVRTTYDPSGNEGRLFGALTSGYTVLYDLAGRLQFSGGITGARGHVGRNAGVSRLLHAVTTQTTGGTHQVYGCPL